MKTLISLLVALGLGTAASAQDFYGGATLDYGLPHSGDTQTLGSLIAGVGAKSGAVGYGAEVELGLHLAGDADFETQRLRLWGTYDLDRVTIRASAGLTEYDIGNGEGGYHLGLGVQRAITDKVTLRGEFIRDFMDDVPFVTTTRIGVTYHF